MDFTKIVILKILRNTQNTGKINGFRTSGRMRKTTISPKSIEINRSQNMDFTKIRILEIL